mmetsp:Transcript_8130/g.50335  ORF Transcript_8130/g.50335 Transcript_8130/m.50335 type:complete len:82 (-) Transcript_8130:29-274(-)
MIFYCITGRHRYLQEQHWKKCTFSASIHLCITVNVPELLVLVDMDYVSSICGLPEPSKDLCKTGSLPYPSFHGGSPWPMYV